MKLRRLTTSLLRGIGVAMMGAALTTSALSQNVDADAALVQDSWIFVFDKSVTPNAVSGLAERAVRLEGARLDNVYNTALRGFSARMPAKIAARLAAANPAISHYEPDQIMRIVMTQPPPPPPAPSQDTPWGVARVNGGVSGVGKTAWVIDTGIDLDHPDLTVDTGRSRSFLGFFNNSANDGHGHGTHVAGTIAAKNNGVGVIGVAAGATVVAVRVLGNNGSGSNSGVIAGVDYVAANGQPGDVANMSLGGAVSAALDQAVINAASKGIKFSLAAGNESEDANNHSPARAEGPNIWTVSAIDDNDRFASFSNFGSHVDCAAPGVNVRSTFKDARYEILSGTSMAAPHVAGVLLLGGAPRTDGTATNDLDGNPDPICVY